MSASAFPFKWPLRSALPEGELKLQEHQAIVDVQAKKRLNALLDILVRLQLLKTYLYSENKFQSRIERSVFIALPDVAFEEPKAATARHAVSRPGLMQCSRANPCGHWTSLATLCCKSSLMLLSEIYEMLFRASVRASLSSLVRSKIAAMHGYIFCCRKRQASTRWNLTCEMKRTSRGTGTDWNMSA